ncbi:hypothetical protein PIB30_078687 [Stylosanthes scabra]|uniref:Uncharacterized protein n=1 Tax=Stylosanthes scabra TaxID=79078 RepID=A0ABU6YSC0_9FABA|nr:hypothetical protein [Stylosanthes scabra]
MTLHGNVQERTNVLDGVRVALTWMDVMTVVAEKPYLGYIPRSRRTWEANRHMSSWPALGSGMHHTCSHRCLLSFTLRVDGKWHHPLRVREAREVRDYDLKADPVLGNFKIRRYHFDNEYFVHPLHSIRFDLDRPYEVPIEALMADQPLSSSDKGRTSARGSHRPRRSSPTPHYSPRMSSSTRRVVSPSPIVASSFLRHKVASTELRPLKSWELIPLSEGWMCDGDEEEKEIEGMEPSMEKEEASKENEEEEDPE